jgi:hypothetical protein
MDFVVCVSFLKRILLNCGFDDVTQKPLFYVTVVYIDRE